MDNKVMTCYQAIQTHYLPPTNYRGSRIVARCDAKRLVVPYPYDLSGAAVHAHAAQKLAEALDWEGTWYGGALPGNAGYAFVVVPERFAGESAFVVRRASDPVPMEDERSA